MTLRNKYRKEDPLNKMDTFEAKLLEKTMIPQLISDDQVRSFRKHLASQGFLLRDEVSNDELAQILSAWTEWKGPEKLSSAQKVEEPHGYERLEKLKKENS